MKEVMKCRSLRTLFACEDRWTKGLSHGYKIHDRLFTLAGCKLIPVGGRECFCLYGGVEEIYGKDPARRNRVLGKLLDAIKRQRKSAPRLNIVAWNDHKTTKFKHIRKVIEEAKV